MATIDDSQWERITAAFRHARPDAYPDRSQIIDEMVGDYVSGLQGPAHPAVDIRGLTDLLIKLYSNPNATPRRHMYEGDARQILALLGLTASNG